MLTTLNAYWRTCPPVHVSVAAYLGIGKAASRKSGGGNQAVEAAMELGPARAFKPRVPIQGTEHERQPPVHDHGG